MARPEEKLAWVWERVRRVLRGKRRAFLIAKYREWEQGRKSGRSLGRKLWSVKAFKKP